MCNCYECRIRGRAEERHCTYPYCTDARGRCQGDCDKEATKPVKEPVVPNDIALGKQMVFPGLTTEQMSAKL